MLSRKRATVEYYFECLWWLKNNYCNTNLKCYRVILHHKWIETLIWECKNCFSKDNKIYIENVAKRGLKKWDDQLGVNLIFTDKKWLPWTTENDVKQIVRALVEKLTTISSSIWAMLLKTFMLNVACNISAHNQFISCNISIR